MFNWLYGPILIAKADRLGTYAAALAYCFVLSLIPFLVVTFTLASQLAPGKLNLGGAYQDLLNDILPAITSSPPAYRPTTEEKPGEFRGLGLTVGMKDGAIELLSVIDDTPASHAGLMAGDRILFIDGRTTEHMTLTAVYRAMKGMPGDKTRLELWRPINGYPAARDVFDVVLEHPRDLSAQIVATLQTSSHRGLATIGFILAVYTSFNLMMQITRTLLFIFDDHRRPLDWSLTMVLKTIALLIIWMFLLLVISMVSVMTPVIQKILDQFHLDSQLWTTPLLIGRDALLLASLFGAFFLTFYLVPTRQHKMSLVRTGSLVASLGWVLCSLVFAYILPSMWRTNAVYEALGSVVVILLWAQACAWSVIIGACWIVRFSPRAK